MSNFDADGSPALDWKGAKYTLSKIQVRKLCTACWAAKLVRGALCTVWG